MFFIKERSFLTLLDEKIVINDVTKILKHDFNVTLDLNAEKIITLIKIAKRLDKLNVTYVTVITNITTFLKEVRNSFADDINKVKIIK